MDLSELVEASDISGLLRYVDSRIKDREWSDVLEAGIRCRDALERGKQLGGVAQYVEYRTALDAPAPLAASVVEEGAGRNTLGPLWEVMASTHNWADLEPWLEPGRVRMMVAHERALRGDKIDEAEIEGTPLVTPLHLLDWELACPPAVYRPDGADFPNPETTGFEDLEISPGTDAIEDIESEDALYDLVRPWVDQSNGAAGVVVIEGTAESAIATLGATSARGADVDLAAALAHMGWAAASGGAYGTRRGNPVGRSYGWYAAATLLDVDPHELADHRDEGQWMLWTSSQNLKGWNLGVALEHDGLAFALYAHDHIDEPGRDEKKLDEPGRVENES